MDVAQGINKIKSKATGVNYLNPIFLKMILHIVLPYIAHILNTVLTTSVFPDIWQKSKVIPIPKTQNEYRLISILPFLSKWLEKILLEQNTKFVHSTNFLNEMQSGFRANWSCQTAFIKVSDDISKSLDCNNVTFLALLDHSKAFDCVMPDILCYKLSNFANLSSSAIRLIFSYLTNRSQAVFYENKYSISKHAKGCPTGIYSEPFPFLGLY